MSAVSLEFIPIDSPAFVTVDIVNPEAWGSLDLPIAVQQDAIIRIRYQATREQDAVVDKDRIRRELLAAGAARVTIEPQITREVRARVETLTQDLSETDALALYAGAQGIEPAMAERMGSRLREWIA
jgi:hypothetical protein